jgi:hypothetical protein
MIKYLVTICLMLLLYTNSALAMPPIMTTSELKPGMQGYAETVVQGAQQVSFNVEIIGVVNNGKGSSKQILARAYGPIIEETNGVIHGMSGSPVYVDGKLIGAVARAVGQDVLPYKFYITPIEEMLKIWTLPDPLAVINKSNIEKVKIPSLEEYEKNQDNYDENIDKEDPRKGSHDHDTFQCDIDHTASFRIHCSDCNDQKRNGKIHRLLYNEICYIHDCPSFPARSVPDFFSAFFAFLI